MTPEHVDILIAKCSKYNYVDMPEFPEQSQTPRKEVDTDGPTTVTPSTSDRDSLAASDRDSSGVDTASENDEDPTPADKPANKPVNRPGNKPADKPATVELKHAVKPNKQMLETHRKWQEAAEAIGGPGSRIIVSKVEAKKLIYDVLYDAFQPMNITQIYQVCCFSQ